MGQELKDAIKRLDDHMAWGAIFILSVLLSIILLLPKAKICQDQSGNPKQSANNPLPLSQPKFLDGAVQQMDDLQVPRPHNLSMARIP